MDPTETADALQRMVTYVDGLPPDAPAAERRAMLVYRSAPGGRRKGWFCLLGPRDEGEEVGLHDDPAEAIEAELAEEEQGEDDDDGA